MKTRNNVIKNVDIESFKTASLINLVEETKKPKNLIIHNKSNVAIRLIFESVEKKDSKEVRNQGIIIGAHTEKPLFMETGFSKIGFRVHDPKNGKKYDFNVEYSTYDYI